MKTKFLFLAVLFIFTNYYSYAQTPGGDEITLELQIDNTNSGSNGMPKSPPTPPQASILDHTLFFTSAHSEYTLTLTNDSGQIVYMTSVSASMTQTTLPTSLIGDYEIKLSTGYYCFVGYIHLE